MAINRNALRWYAHSIFWDDLLIKINQNQFTSAIEQLDQ